jgi:thioesterase domain-containing protein
MRSVRPHGPYFLGGYCFGGVIAFEIAHQLRRLNEDVRLLVMLEPDNPIIRQSTAYSAQSISVVLSIATSFIDWISRHKTRLNSLQPKEKARYILERAARRIRGNCRWIRIMCDKTIKRAVYRTYLALGYAIPPSLRSRYILDIYEEATAHYAQEVYPGRLTVFKVGHNSDASAWGRFAAEGLELYEISGDHRAILREPYVQQWAKTLSIEIARAQIATETQKESVQSSTWTENR